MQRHSIIYLAFFLAVQVIVLAAPRAAPPTIEEARIELFRLYDAITTSRYNAFQASEKERESIIKLSNDVISIGTDLIRREASRLNLGLERIRNESAGEHANVSFCFNAKKEVIAKLKSANDLDLSVCADKNSKQGLLSLDIGLVELGSLLDNVYDLYIRLENSQVDDVSSIAHIIAEIRIQQTNSPKRIQEILDDSANKVKANKFDLSDCAIRVAEKFVIDGSEIVSYVQKCVDHVIDPKPKAN